MKAATSRHWTYADYRSWPEETRCELVDGRVFDMSPAPSREHQRVLRELVLQLGVQLRGHRCEVYIAPFDVRLPRADEDDDAVDTVVQPDVSVICDPGKLDERGCRGAPDWVIEVVSPSNAAHDQIVKRTVYERHGVREYWLVHPTERTVTVYRHGPSGYGKPEIQVTEGKTASTAAAGLEVDWDVVFPEPVRARP